ncbi:MAG TPA: dihydrofolate reductase family protein [Myxococcaceae bacterium]|jgi:dihydrofolate reductase
MRKLIYHVASTVDGFIARADDTYDCFPMNPGDENITDFMASLAGYGAVVMGRRTYEPALKVGVTDPYPNLDTYVFSRSIKESPHPKVKVISEDAPGAIRRLKEQDGKDIYLCGGGEFASMLFMEGLVDELLLKLNPLLLGSGIPLSPKLKEHIDLKLMSSKVYSTGVVLLRYAVQKRGK